MTRSRLRILVLSLIVMGLIIAGLYGIRTFLAFKDVRGQRPAPDSLLEEQPRETDVELIRDWMTIPYIARMYHVPASVLYKSLDISPDGNQEKSIQQLNDEYYPQEQGWIEATIKISILEYQAQNEPDEDAGPPVP
ncbi:MAG TPA: hypothetical protein VJ785_16610 [Anaerolineales bacterium]|nr:hypothetical protein [Anaerolineales bacterium]